MSADQAQVVGQHVTIQLLTELGTKRTATGTANESTKDCPRYGSEGDAQRASNSTNCCAGLATGQGSTGATSGTTYSTDRSGDLHCMVE